MTGDDYQAFSRDTLGVGTMYRYQVGAEYVEFQPLALNWVNDQDSRQQITQPVSTVAQVVNGDTLRFAGGYGAGRHFEYECQPGRLQKRLVLDTNNLPAATVTGSAHLEIEFILSKSAGVTEWINGTQWDRSTRTITTDHIEYRTSGGAVLWALEAPKAWDANGSQAAGQMVLRRQGPNRYVTIRFPKTWIDAATFPVTIDPTITNQTVGASSDDANQNATGAINLVASPSAIIDATNEWLGARWDISGSTIAAGSTINSCTVTCEFPTATLDEPDHPMYFQRAASPGTFTTTNGDISSRTRTTASVTWSSADLGAPGDFTSPDLSTPLQEVVDNHGPLDAIVWIVNGSADANRDLVVTMYDGSTSLCPRLSVTWTESGGGASKPNVFMLLGVR